MLLRFPQRRDLLVLMYGKARCLMNLRCLSCLMARMTSFTLRPPRICVNRDYNRRRKKESSSGICPHNCPTTYVSHYQGRSFIFPLRHLPFMDSLSMTSSSTIFNGKRERHCWRLISCPSLNYLGFLLFCGFSSVLLRK